MVDSMVALMKKTDYSNKSTQKSLQRKFLPAEVLFAQITNEATQLTNDVLFTPSTPASLVTFLPTEGLFTQVTNEATQLTDDVRFASSGSEKSLFSYAYSLPC